MLMSGSAWVGGHSTSRVSEERSLRLEPALEVPLSYLSWFGGKFGGPILCES
jgi:hypothetical protein